MAGISIAGIKQDSLVVGGSTNDSIKLEKPKIDTTIQKVAVNSGTGSGNDTVNVPQIQSNNTKQRIAVSKKDTLNGYDHRQKQELATQTNVVKKPVTLQSPVIRYTLFNESGKQIATKPESFWTEKTPHKNNPAHLKIIPHHYLRSQFNWALIVGLTGIILLIGLKVYYQKFVNQVFNTIVNFQLADKLLREKNVLARRAFFIMNVNFILIFSLFVLLISNFFGFHITGNYVYDYLLILTFILIFLLFRLFILNIMAMLFDTAKVVIEHIHISYLINKNLGLVLLPLVFAAMYTPEIISHILLISGLGLFFLANFYKVFRSFQIIIRNGVLIYYAILYLCTLELLPLLIGSKILISLR